MARVFSILEVVNIAVDDEEAGAAFYSVLAESASDTALRSTFADLAEQEKGHKQRFEKLLRELADGRDLEPLTGESSGYLQALVGSLVFTNEQAAQTAARGCPNDAAAIDLAIRFERDTLALMQELLPLVPEKDAAVIEKLKQEERSHLVTLAEARKILAT